MIEKLPSGKFRTRIYYKGRYVTSKTFRLKTDASAWDREARQALVVGRPLPGVSLRSPADNTVGAWFERLEATKTGKKSAAKDRRGLYRNHIEREFGKLPVSAVSHEAVAGWAKKLATKRSASIARRSLTVLRQTLAAAMADKQIERNPAIGIKLPAPRGNEPRPLSQAQLWQLVEAMPTERDKAMCLVMGVGGLRFGECVALTPADVTSSGVNVSKSVEDVNGKLTVGETKTHKSRFVALPPNVGGRVLTWAKSFNEHDFIFSTRTKTPIRNGNWRRSIWKPALKAAELADDLTPHNLRDTAASLLISAGADVVEVANQLGHANPSTTLAHYAGFFPTQLEQTLLKLDLPTPDRHDGEETK